MLIHFYVFPISVISYIWTTLQTTVANKLFRKCILNLPCQLSITYIHRINIHKTPKILVSFTWLYHYLYNFIGCHLVTCNSFISHHLSYSSCASPRFGVYLSLVTHTFLQPPALTAMQASPTAKISSLVPCVSPEQEWLTFVLCRYLRTVNGWTSLISIWQRPSKRNYYEQGIPN